MRRACILEHGQLYDCLSEKEFEFKLKHLKSLNKQVCSLDNDIRTSIYKAIDGQDPGLLIIKDDEKLD